ncbi:MAG TPA: magnesium transporter, partial [Mariniflexile sp.]
MSEEIENIQFELTDDLINQVERLIKVSDDKALQKLLKDFHYADIAEILDELDLDEAVYIIKLLDSETTADILMELDEDNREKVLRNLSSK